MGSSRITAYVYCRAPTPGQIASWSRLAAGLGGQANLKIVTDEGAIASRGLTKLPAAVVRVRDLDGSSYEFLVECDEAGMSEAVQAQVGRMAERVRWWSHEPVAPSVGDGELETDAEVVVEAPDGEAPEGGDAPSDVPDEDQEDQEEDQEEDQDQGQDQEDREGQDQEGDEAAGRLLLLLHGSDGLGPVAAAAVSGEEVRQQEEGEGRVVTALQDEGGTACYFGPWTPEAVRAWVDGSSSAVGPRMHMYRRPESRRCDKWEAALSMTCGVSLVPVRVADARFPVLSVNTPEGCETLVLRSGLSTSTARRWVFDSLCALRAL